MKKWTNKHTYQWINEWMNEWMMNEWMNERMIECMNEWTIERTNEWTKEWMIDWVNEWMNEYITVFVKRAKRYLFCINGHINKSWPDDINEGKNVFAIYLFIYYNIIDIILQCYVNQRISIL